LIREYSWDMHPTDPMIILVKHNDNVVQRIFLGEAMECAGKTAVMKHVDVCNNTPWITSWHDEMWVALNNTEVI
jgi:hypothetical protein